MAGHIKKRTLRDGSASYQARIPSPSNRDKDAVRTFAKKRDAERWLAAQAAALDRGDFIDHRRGETPLRAVADEWRETWADLAPKTRVGVRVDPHPPRSPRLRFGAGSRDLPQGRSGLPQRPLGDGPEVHTVRRIADVIRGVLALAVDRRYISSNPCAAVRLPRKGESRNVEIQPLTHGEVGTLVDALPEHWRLPVLLDAYTGLRAGELWALRRRDVDALRGELSVNEALKVSTGLATFIRTEARCFESGKSRMAAATLSAKVHGRRAQRLRLGSTGTKVAPTFLGTPVSRPKAPGFRRSNRSRRSPGRCTRRARRPLGLD
jgi:integrase